MHHQWCLSRAVLALLAAILLTSSSRGVQGQDEVVSVGGFVTTSPQVSAALSAAGLPAPDLAAVRVALFTPAGVKASEGDCSPNGYYFVAPVDPGTYTVRVQPPPGWLFAPAQLSITCDQRQCNAGDDVSFELTGLELSGHVEPGPSAPSCKAAAAAPAASFTGITVSVKPADSKDAAATAAVTDSSFAAGPLLPGRYVVTASHPDWQLGPSRISHMLSLEAPQLPRAFQVSGFTLTGSVTSRSGPVAGIQVTLCSTDLTTAGCSSSHPPAAAAAAASGDAAATALCSVTTGPSGQFALPGVPCGSYTLQAAHPSPDSTFEITPASMAVAVGHGNAAVPEPFTVTGFSVQGRVVDGSGNGVPGVAISVAGQQRTTTDSMGRYVLGRMQEGRVDISATKEHFSFSALSAVQVTPAAQVVPDMLVKTLAVCGKLLYGSDTRFKSSGRRVSLTSTDEGGIAQQVAADASGGFCFSVPAGRFRIAPYVSGDEKSRGLLFSPSHTDLALVGEPQLDLAFSQAQLVVSGSVACLDGECPADIQLTLKTAAGKVAYAAMLGEVAATQGAAGATTFKLPRISPGRYKLVASRTGWCWQAPDGVEVAVEAADVEAPALSQAGYLLQYSASHVAELSITSPSGEPVATLPAAAGKGSVCLPGSGAYTVTPSSCYLFPSESFTVDVAPSKAPQPLTLRAAKVSVSGQITVQASDGGDASLPDSITVTAALADAADTQQAAGVITKARASDPDKPHVFDYTLAVDLGSTMVISPSVGDDSQLLFYPRSQIFKHDASAQACPPAVQGIQAKPGVVVAGRVEPEVKGAQVRVTFKTASAAAGGLPGDLAAEGLTDAGGSFSLGRLYDDASYAVELVKPGHIITADGQDNGQWLFKSKQLAQVGVSVALPAGSEPSAVFLSLSGGGGFKNNARLGADRTLTFLDLQPGTYYLKPLLREHTFEPPVANLELEDGQAAEVTLTALRTAWGIGGTVTSVGGSPMPGAVVEACQGSGAAAVVLDSSVTDEAGAYRVGNLKPGQTYTMRVRLDGRVISAHPAGKQVALGKADVAGVNFIAFRTSSRSALSGAVQLPRGLRAATIKAELLPAGKSSVPAAAGVGLDASGFFELRGIKPGSYKLRLSCDAGAAGGLSCDSYEQTVQVGSKDVHLGFLPFQPAAAAASAASPGGTAAAAMSDEGLDWKAPVLVLGLLLAASLTIFQPAIVDILQLRPAGSGAGGDASFDTPAVASRAASRRASAADGGSSKPAPAVARQAAPAATVAAAAVDLPTSSSSSSSSDDEEDVAVRPAGRAGAAGLRTRARRA